MNERPAFYFPEIELVEYLLASYTHTEVARSCFMMSFKEIRMC